MYPQIYNSTQLKTTRDYRLRSLAQLSAPCLHQFPNFCNGKKEVYILIFIIHCVSIPHLPRTIQSAQIVELQQIDSHFRCNRPAFVVGVPRLAQ
jgi:hypothetical protein